MFNRAVIKARAKQNLKDNYWTALGVAVVAGLLTGNVTSYINISSDSGMPQGVLGEIADVVQSFPILSILFVLLSFVALGAFVVALASTFFISGPLTVGGMRYFTNLSKGQAKFSDIFYAFKNHTPGSYFNVCKVMVLRLLFLFLWGLIAIVPAFVVGLGVTISALFGEMAGILLMLFGIMLYIPSIIPLIIKTYEYFAVPYLLAEFPDMKYKQAFAASKQLTQGHKGDLFLLELSFIGWVMLGVLCFGIGALFVTPYMAASNAEAYACLCALKNPPATPSAEAAQIEQ